MNLIKIADDTHVNTDHIALVYRTDWGAIELSLSNGVVYEIAQGDNYHTQVLLALSLANNEPTPAPAPIAPPESWTPHNHPKVAPLHTQSNLPPDDKDGIEIDRAKDLLIQAKQKFKAAAQSDTHTVAINYLSAGLSLLCESLLCQED